MTRRLPRRIPIAPLVALLLAAGVGTVAQEVPEGPLLTEVIPTLVPEVVVTAPRLPVPLRVVPSGASLVDPPVLEEMPRQVSADEALELVPGVRADNPSDTEEVFLSVRGVGHGPAGEVRGVEVLLDGIPLSDPSGTSPGFPQVDWSSVERVEVLRGPHSTLYGASGAGGALHIVTRDGPKGLPSRRAFMTVGEDGFWRAYAEVGGGDRRATLYRLSASRTFGSGYRDHASFWSTSLNGKFRWNLDPFGSYLTAILHSSEHMNQDPGALGPALLRADPKQAAPEARGYDTFRRGRFEVAGISGKMVYSLRHDLTFSAFGRRSRERGSWPAAVERADATSPGTTLQYNWHLGQPGRVRQHLSFGFDARWDDLDLTWSPNLGLATAGGPAIADASVRQRTAGSFVLERLEFGRTWFVDLSVRRDRIRQEVRDREPSPDRNLSTSVTRTLNSARVGVTFSPMDLLNLYAAYGEGFLPPSPRDAVAASVATGRGVIPVPSRSKSWELGARGVLEQVLYYDATLFYATSDGELAYAYGGVPWQASGRGATERVGLEASATWFPAWGLALRGSYALSRFTYDRLLLPSAGGPGTAPTDCSGRRVPNSPDHRLRADIQYDWQNGWSLALAVEARSRAYADPANTSWAGGTALFEPRASYTWKRRHLQGEVRLQVRNALGREYSAWGLPAPGGGAFYPAPERQLFLGLRIAWERPR